MHWGRSSLNLLSELMPGLCIFKKFHLHGLNVIAHCCFCQHNLLRQGILRRATSSRSEELWPTFWSIWNNLILKESVRLCVWPPPPRHIVLIPDPSSGFDLNLGCNKNLWQLPWPERTLQNKRLPGRVSCGVKSIVSMAHGFPEIKSIDRFELGR